MRIARAIAGSIGSVILAIAITKGHFQWLPDWFLLLAFLACAALWLTANENVRVLVQCVWTGRVAGEIVDIHGKLARHPRRIGKRGTIIAVAIIGCGVVASIGAWQITKGFIYTLKGTVEQISLFYSSPGYSPALANPIMAAIVTLHNQGRYPTSVSDFWLTIKWKDRESARIKASLLSNVLTLPYLDGHRETMYPEDDLVQKGSAPIPAGGQVVGRLLFQDSSINPYRLQNERPDIRIDFTDVRGNNYSIMKSTEWPATGTDREFPGMHPRFAKP